MNAITNIPTQNELDFCQTMQDKFHLKPPELCYELNERGISKLFSEITHPYLLYNVSQKKWMYYNGKHWEVDEGNVFVQREMKLFSHELLKYAVNEVGMANEEFLEFVQSLGGAAKRKTLIKDAIDNNFVTEDAFDNNIYLFNCQNGTFDLRTQQLLPHNPKDMITKISKGFYVPGATSPILDNFMNDIFCGDTDLINYMYRVLGYCLSGLNNQECFFILLGETTRNGKSTLLNTFSFLLGENAGYSRNADISSFAQKKSSNGSAPSSDICRLRGSRFVIASEPAPDFVLDESKVKSFTGQDAINARMLYANNIEFKPTFKILIGTNHRPNISDDSVLESNRLRVIPFNRHFSVDEQNKSLKERLILPDVLSALLNKSINGFAEFQQIGLSEPEAVINATAQYQTQGQILQLFFDSQLIKEPGAVIPLAVFYPFYLSWCTENGFTPLTREKTNSYMRSKNLFKATATIDGKTIRNILSGYRLKTEKDRKDSLLLQSESVKSIFLNCLLLFSC